MRKLLEIIIIVFLLSALLGCGGRDIVYDKNHALHGKTIMFKTPMLYTKNLKDTTVEREEEKYNRYLIREKEKESYADSHHKSGKQVVTQIKNSMKFKVVKSYMVKPWGYLSAFVSEYRILVLLDEDKKLSTIGEFAIYDDEIIK